MYKKLLNDSKKNYTIQAIICAVLIIIGAVFELIPVVINSKEAIELGSVREGVADDEMAEMSKYDKLEGKYVTLDVPLVITEYYKDRSSTNSSTVQHYGYLIYDFESGYYMGIYVSPSRSNEVWRALYKETQKWLEDDTYPAPEPVTIKGTFRKMKGSELNNFKATCVEWIGSYNDYVLMYTIDETGFIMGDEGWRAIGFVFLYVGGLWGVIIAIMFFTKNSIKGVKKYIKKNGLNEAEVEQDLETAKKFKHVYVGNKYTFFRGVLNWKMVDHTQMVWAYYYRRTGRYAVSRINSWMSNGKAVYINLSENEANQVLVYYADRFSYILVGYDAEIEKMYKKNLPELLLARKNRAENNTLLNETASSQAAASDTTASENSYTGEQENTEGGTLQSDFTDSEKYHETGAYAVRLTASDEKKVKTIDVVRKVTGLGLAQAKQLVETENAIILRDLSYYSASELVTVFEKLGNKADVISIYEI